MRHNQPLHFSLLILLLLLSVLPIQVSSSRNTKTVAENEERVFLPLIANRLNAEEAESWTQVGTDIYGEAAYTYFGRVVSLSEDGNRLAVEAPHPAGRSRAFTGFVRIYELNSGVWEQLGSDILNVATEGLTGQSVSLAADGNRVSVGSPGDNSIGVGSGSVRIFEWVSGGWVQLGTTIDGELGGDGAGHAVSISADGSRVAIGAPLNDGNGPASGHVRVFEWQSGMWVQLGDDIDGETSSDQSGHSVSISADGNRVAVGAMNNNGNGNWSGHVRVFAWQSGNWVQLGADIDGEAEFDRSGNAVSLSADGKRVAIGASLNDANGTNSGHVRIFEWDTASWVQLGVDIDGELENDMSGGAVSLSVDGNRVAIGASGADGNGVSSGQTRIFEWKSGAWKQLGETVNGDAAYDFAGWSVSLSDDGARVAIGAPDNDGYDVDSGQVQIFEFE